MSRFNPHKLPTAIAVALIAGFALLAVGCSKDSSTAPPATNTGGPAFSFTFPTTGASHQFTFPTAGSYDYHCIPHQSGGMVGTVIVDANSAVTAASVDVGGTTPFRFTPGTVTIKPGGTVTWTNTSALSNHTVTRP